MGVTLDKGFAAPKTVANVHQKAVKHVHLRLIVGGANVFGRVGHVHCTSLLVGREDGAQARDGRKRGAKLEGVDDQHGWHGDVQCAQETGFGVYKGSSFVKVEDFMKGVFGGGGLKERQAEVVGMLDESRDRCSHVLGNSVFGEQNRTPLAKEVGVQGQKAQLCAGRPIK